MTAPDGYEPVRDAIAELSLTEWLALTANLAQLLQQPISDESEHGGDAA